MLNRCVVFRACLLCSISIESVLIGTQSVLSRCVLNRSPICSIGSFSIVLSQPVRCVCLLPSAWFSLLICLSSLSLKDKAIEIISRLCGDQPVVLAGMLIARSKTIGLLADRILQSSDLEVRVGVAALLICAVKEHMEQANLLVDKSGYLKHLIHAILDMIKQNSKCCSVEIEVGTPNALRAAFHEEDEIEIPNPSTVLGGTVSLWLLSLISSFSGENKCTVMEAGGVEDWKPFLRSSETIPLMCSHSFC